jgi:hypothetical protein
LIDERRVTVGADWRSLFCYDSFVPVAKKLKPLSNLVYILIDTLDRRNCQVFVSDTLLNLSKQANYFLIQSRYKNLFEVHPGEALIIGLIFHTFMSFRSFFARRYLEFPFTCLRRKEKD